jgi:hypothetical protein
MSTQDVLKRARNMTCTCVNNGDYCESCQIKQGCGKQFHVIGTNGGTMACGAFLTIFGTRKREYCASCKG